MIAKKLTSDLSVAEQINPGDLAEVAKLGFKSIMSNRPDGEGEGQPSFAEIANEAHRLGLEVRYIPVVSGKLTDEDTAAFQAAIEVMPKPILAYCRTGTRCTTLWALSQVGQRTVDDILNVAQNAGYDLKGVEARLHALVPLRSNATN
ncbi:MAG: TIGR01244 family phosphatase [Proteobacteria bacterium]|nr:TIGR01244 family phosphatase [Pseudomonadota bacterium]